MAVQPIPALIPVFVKPFALCQLQAEEHLHIRFFCRGKDSADLAAPVRMACSAGNGVLLMVVEVCLISVDGIGTVLTTEACLLSKGRNPDLSRAEIEKRVCEGLGAEKVIWLPGGILGDETNEHVDNICVFAGEQRVLLSWCEDENDPQHEVCKACLSVLLNSTDAKGRKIEVIKLPMPKPVYMTKEEVEGLDYCFGEPTRDTESRLSASYVNLYIGNKVVVMPAFGGENEDCDKRAQQIVAEAFPDKEIIPIYARDILIGGGNIHCITHQIPLYRKEG